MKPDPWAAEPGRPKLAPAQSPSHRAPEPAYWQGLVQAEPLLQDTYTNSCLMSGHLRAWAEELRACLHPLVCAYALKCGTWDKEAFAQKPKHLCLPSNYGIFPSTNPTQDPLPPEKPQQPLASKNINFLYPQSFFRYLPTKKEKRNREIGTYNIQRGKLISHQYIHPVKAWISARSLKVNEQPQQQWLEAILAVPSDRRYYHEELLNIPGLPFSQDNIHLTVWWIGRCS